MNTCHFCGASTRQGPSRSLHVGFYYPPFCGACAGRFERENIDRQRAPIADADADTKALLAIETPPTDIEITDFCYELIQALRTEGPDLPEVRAAYHARMDEANLAAYRQRSRP